MTRIAILLFGSLMMATGLAIAIGPVRLLAGLVAVPMTAAIIATLALAVWVVFAMHGG
jgi:hypothetical protein